MASAETYHVAHGRWETKAPMSVLIPFKEGGNVSLLISVGRIASCASCALGDFVFNITKFRNHCNDVVMSI